MSRFIVLWCPNWPILAARADSREGITDTRPIALSRGHYITACSVEAAAEGVHPGQRVREAQASCTTLQLLSEQPERDQRLFDTVLTHLSHTVARVSVLEPGLIACQARGIARYYGSENAAAEALRHACAHSPVPVAARVGIADSLFTAQQAARLGTSDSEPVCVVEPGADAHFLAPLPVSTLGDPHLAALLDALGVSTLAQFAQMDSSQVHERFGPPGAMLQQWSRGLDPRVSHVQDTPASTDTIWRSDDPVDQLDVLSFSLLGSATRFIDSLIAQHTVCTTVRITMVDDTGKQFIRTWSHPRYFTASDLVNRVRWQWEAESADHPQERTSWGIVEVRFEALTPDDIVDHEPGLWGSTPISPRVEHAIAQLQSQLGHHAVSRAHPRSGHDWAETESVVPWGEAHPLASVPHDAPWPGSLPKPLPATVFSPPVPVTLVDQAEQSVAVHLSELSAEPARLVWGNLPRIVTAWAGPWPVVERWWDSEKAQHCHRLQLLDRDGVGWLLSTKEGAQWVVEARYD